jgi:transglutaminase superfamily protein
MKIKIYISGSSIPFNNLVIKDRIHSANTATFKSPKKLSIMKDVRIIGDIPEFGGQITKRKEAEEGYEYECMDYSRLLHGKIKISFKKKTGSYIIKKLLSERKLKTGGVIKTKKKHGKIVFKDVKAIDAIQQIVNLQYKDTSEDADSENIVTPSKAVNGTCGKCGWTPKKKVSFKNECPHCKKKGKIGRLKWSPKGKKRQEWTCKKCGADYCAKCGKEKLKSSKTYLIKSNSSSKSSKVRLEFNVSPDGIGRLKKIPSKEAGYVFYPGSYGDYDLSYDATDIITGVKVYGENDKKLFSYNNKKMVAKYGYITELIFDSNIKTKKKAKNEAKKLFKEKGKIEFSGTITIPILSKMRSDMWLAFKSPKGDVKTYYVQEITTTINSNTAEQKVQMLDGKPATPKEWLYTPPSSSSSGSTSGVAKSVSDLAKKLKTPKACRKWIDKNIDYDMYYNYKHKPDKVLKRGKANCMDQARLFCHMVKTLDYTCKVACGKTCNGIKHCNAEVKINGRTVVVDTTCSKLNRL